MTSSPNSSLDSRLADSHWLSPPLGTYASDIPRDEHASRALYHDNAVSMTWYPSIVKYKTTLGLIIRDRYTWSGENVTISY